jgi:hypothetical protein
LALARRTAARDSSWLFRLYRIFGQGDLKPETTEDIEKNRETTKNTKGQENKNFITRARKRVGIGKTDRKEQENVLQELITPSPFGFFRAFVMKFSFVFFVVSCLLSFFRANRILTAT